MTLSSYQFLMKSILFLLAIILPVALYAQSDVGAIRIGGGYAHDFPGMNGFGTFGEYTRPLTERWQGAIAGKWSKMQGFPRTNEVKEYTRAFGLDFTLYFKPLVNESHEIRIGAGYSFSFYNIRRTNPVLVNGGGAPETEWPIQDEKGRSGGLNLVGEYQYHFSNSNFFIGARGSWFKAYDPIVYFGPFVGINL